MCGFHFFWTTERIKNNTWLGLKGTNGVKLYALCLRSEKCLKIVNRMINYCI